MRGGVLGFLFGSVTLSYPVARHTAVLSYLLAHGIGAMECRLAGEEGVLVLRRRDAAALPPALGCRAVGEDGLFVLLARLLRRPGLLIGAGLGVCLLILSSLTVWRVEVMGNERLAPSVIEAAVRDAGLSVGDLTPMADIAAVRTRVLRDHPEISWIGIYIRGTTVAVEVREATLHDSAAPTLSYCNLVASADAVVESITVDAGRAAVSVGASVRKGDLLISGIYRTAGGLAAVCAAGEVRGRTVREIEVVVPRERVQRTYEESITTRFAIDFFGVEIKLFQKDLKSVKKYDIIEKKEQVMLFGFLPLPLFRVWEECLPYSEVSVTMSDAETEATAKLRLREKMAEALSDAEVLTEETHGEWTADGYTLTLRAECVASIVAPLAYEVLEDGG